MAIDILQAFEQPPAPLDFVLPGLIAGTVGGIVSPGGAGKSMFALELAAFIATGHDLTGFANSVPYTKGQVAFLAAEDPADAIKHRIHALGKHLPGEHHKAFAENCYIEPLAGRQANLARKDWADYVESVAVGKRLVFLDTLRRFHEFDENDSGQMAQLIGIIEGIADRTKCAIVFLHHASKSAAMNGQGDSQQASRGSSVLVDNIRWQMFLAGASKDDAKKLSIDEAKRSFFVRAGISKQNYGPPSPELWLRRETGGILVPAEFSTCTVTRKKGGAREQI